MRFLTEFYSLTPKIKIQLEDAELIGDGALCEIRIPIYKEQEKWLGTKKIEGLFETLTRIRIALSRFQEEFPGLESITFTLKLSSGVVLSTHDLGIDDFKLEDDASEKFHNTLTIEENLPDDMHSQIAISLASALCAEDLEAIDNLLNDNVHLVSYGKRTEYGREAVINYWKWLFLWLHSNHLVSDYHIIYNEFLNRAIVSFQQRNYSQISTEEASVFLYIEENRITTLVITPKEKVRLPNVDCYYYDIPALNYDDIMIYKDKALTPEPNKMPCLHCGRLSEELEWYNLYVDKGPLGHLGHIGHASVCPYCKRETEFFRHIFYSPILIY